jgi:3-phenylpropionate/trans-cinnamate dioxygenase ferredoxin reductase component
VPPSSVAVVGASLAGLAAAQALRDGGHDGDLVVVDPSPALPADRPPLSKQVLAGEWEPERAQQPMAPRLDGLGLDLRLGVAATALDAGTRRLTLSDGSELAPDGIVLAMGASARSLPGPTPAGVHVVRTLEDCLALRADLDAVPSRVVVIGAGFIGAEVAATCRGRGLDVTMIEAAPVPLGRVLPGTIGDFITDLHRDEGVDVRLGVGVDGLDTDGAGRVRAVRMADGTEVAADVVVVGIGVTTNTGWLEGSGLTVDNGVLCDETCLAAPGITAAGDVANWMNAHYGERMRVEHWEHAIEQGEAAGRRLLAEHPDAVPFLAVPWFWSDQYDRKIQMAGRPAAGDELTVVDGSIEERRFVATFRRGDRCTAVLGVNRPRLVIQARMRLNDSLDWAPVAELFA